MRTVDIPHALTIATARRKPHQYRKKQVEEMQSREPPPAGQLQSALTGRSGDCMLEGGYARRKRADL